MKLRNYNKDAMFDGKSGFHQSEEKRNCHICDPVIIITFCFFSNGVHYELLFFISFVAYVCMLYGHVVQECLCGIK